MELPCLTCNALVLVEGSVDGWNLAQKVDSGFLLTGAVDVLSKKIVLVVVDGGVLWVVVCWW